jgi:hypothetical protein
MTGTIEITGTGGIIEGNLGSANVNVNLDAVHGNFNGTTSIINAGSPTMFDDIFASAASLTFWIYPRTVGENSEGRILTKDKWEVYTHAESGGFCRVTFNQKFSTSNGGWRFTDRVVPLNHWSHIAIVYDGSDLSNDAVIYLNGVAQTITETITPAGTRTSDAGDDLIIGNNSGTSRTFDGYIADVKIYKASGLSSTQIPIAAAKINQEPDLISPNPPKGWYKLTADTTTDSSGNSNTASASNMGSVVYDAFSVDVYDNSTTTDGTFTVTQGKVEGKALTSLEFDGSDDRVDIGELGDYTAISMTAWVKPDDASPVNQGIVGSEGNKNGIATGSGSNTLRIKHESVNSSFTDTTYTWLQNQWQQVGFSWDGSTLNVYAGGVQINSVSLSGSAWGMTNADIGVLVDGIWPFDGEIRDVRLYDYGLSEEQMASLYSNTYPQTPKHWYKLDDGSGTTAEDFGTATDVDGTLTNGPTYTNGTLDLDGDFTIAANGTLSAPRGSLVCNVSFLDLGTFTHNSGTVDFDNSSNNYINNDDNASVTAFHNVTHSGGARQRYANSVIIENTLDINNGITQFDGSRTGKSMTFGTATQAGSIDLASSKKLRPNPAGISGGVTWQGASSLFPCVVTGDDWNWSDGTQETKLANMDFQMTIDTSNGSTNDCTLTLTGDCEFDAVTVSSGDTLDLNGQRAFINGDYTQASGSSLDIADSLLVVTGHVDWNGIVPTAGTGAKIIHDTSSEKNWRSMYGTDATFFANGTQTTLTSYHWGGAEAPAKVIAGGIFNTNNVNVASDDVTIPVGGEYNGQGQTLTVAGDFTTSGGLVNVSAFKGVANDRDLIEVADHADLDVTNTFTAEIWFKATRNDVHQYLFDRRGGSSGNAKSWFLYLDTTSDNLGARIRSTSTAAGTTFYGNTTNLADGKWHHAALVYDKDAADGRTKLYVDGKLDVIDDSAEGPLSADDSNFYIGGRYNYVFTWDGNLAEPRLWNVARTQAQIRADMFNSDTLANSTGLVGQWKMTEGTGSTFASTNTNLNGTAVSYSTGSEVAITDAWATAGTFNTSNGQTLTMTGGSGNINYTGDLTLRELTVSGSCTLNGLTGGDVFPLDDTTISGTLASSSNNEELVFGNSFVSNSGLLSFGGNISALHTLKTTHTSGTIDIPNTSTQRLKCAGDGGTTRATATVTFNTELETVSGSTFNGNGNTINAYIIDAHAGSTFDARNSIIKATASGGRTFQFSTSTLLTGNTIIQGNSSSNPVLLYVQADGNHECVGTLQDCEVQANGDITVVGSVIRCTLADSTANIRQFHHTLDTQQLLDADEAGDDDLRLEKPNLDNANELQTG